MAQSNRPQASASANPASTSANPPSSKPKTFKDEVTELKTELKKIRDDAVQNGMVNFHVANLNLGFKEDKAVNGKMVIDDSLPFMKFKAKVETALQQAVTDIGPATPVVNARTGQSMSLEDYSKDFLKALEKHLYAVHQEFQRPGFDPDATPVPPQTQNDWQRLEGKLASLKDDYARTIDTLREDKALAPTALTKAQQNLLAALVPPPATSPLQATLATSVTQAQEIERLRTAIQQTTTAVEQARVALQTKVKAFSDSEKKLAAAAPALQKQYTDLKQKIESKKEEIALKQVKAEDVTALNTEVTTLSTQAAAVKASLERTAVTPELTQYQQLRTEVETAQKALKGVKKTLETQQTELQVAASTFQQARPAVQQELKKTADAQLQVLEQKIAEGKAQQPPVSVTAFEAEHLKIKNLLDVVNTEQGKLDKDNQDKEKLRKVVNELNNMEAEHAAEMHYLRTTLQDKDMARNLRSLFRGQSLKGSGWDGDYMVAGVDNEHRLQHLSLGQGGLKVGAYNVTTFTPSCNYLSERGNRIFLEDERDREGKATGLRTAVCHVSKWLQSAATNYKEARREEMLLLLKDGYKNLVMIPDERLHFSQKGKIGKQQEMWLMTLLNLQYNIYLKDTLPTDPDELKKHANSMIITGSKSKGWQLHVVDEHGLAKKVNMTAAQMRTALPLFKDTIDTKLGKQLQFAKCSEFEDFMRAVKAADSRINALQEAVVVQNLPADLTPYKNQFIITVNKDQTTNKDVYALHTVDETGSKSVKAQASSDDLQKALTENGLLVTPGTALVQTQIDALAKCLVAKDRQILSGKATVVDEQGEVRMISHAKGGVDGRTITSIQSQRQGDDDKCAYLSEKSQREQLLICDYINGAQTSKEVEAALKQTVNKADPANPAPAAVSAQQPPQVPQPAAISAAPAAAAPAAAASPATITTTMPAAAAAPPPPEPPIVMEDPQNPPRP